MRYEKLSLGSKIVMYCNFYKHVSLPIQPASLQLAKLKEINTGLIKSSVCTLFPETRNATIRVACDVYSKNFLTVLCESTDQELLINWKVSEVITNAYNQFELNELDGVNSKNAKLKELLLKAKTLTVLYQGQSSDIQLSVNDIHKIIEEKKVIYSLMKDQMCAIESLPDKITSAIKGLKTQVKHEIYAAVGTAPCMIVNRDTTFIFLYLIIIKTEKLSIMIEHHQPFIRLLKNMVNDNQCKEHHQDFGKILSIHRDLTNRADTLFRKLTSLVCGMGDNMAQTKRDFLKEWKNAQKRLLNEDKATKRTGKNTKKKTPKRSKHRKK